MEAPDCGVVEQYQSRSLVEIDLVSLLIGLCRSVLWQIMEAPEEAPDYGVVEQCQSRSLVEIDLVSLLIGLCRSVLWQIMEAPEEAPDYGVAEQCQSRSLVEIDLSSSILARNGVESYQLCRIVSTGNCKTPRMEVDKLSTW
jgi:general stress protein CsbA